MTIFLSILGHSDEASELDDMPSKVTCSRCHEVHWQSEPACPRCGKTQSWFKFHVPLIVYPIAIAAGVLLYQLLT